MIARRFETVEAIPSRGLEVKNRKNLLAHSVCAMAVMIAVSGCTAQYSEVPIAKNFPTSDQKKLQAAAHWDVVAADISAKLRMEIDGKVQRNEGLYISSSRQTPFNHAVETELIASLVSDGYTVLKTPGNAIEVAVDTRVVEFSPKRIQAKNIGVPTALVSGVWVLSEVDATLAGAATAAVAAADLSRLFNSDNASGATPQTEIMVSVSVSNQNQYLALSKNTYYVTDADINLYRAVRSKTFIVTGDN